MEGKSAGGHYCASVEFPFCPGRPRGRGQWLFGREAVMAAAAAAMEVDQAEAPLQGKKCGAVVATGSGSYELPW